MEKFYCVGQEYGPIWGIGFTREEAIQDVRQFCSEISYEIKEYPNHPSGGLFLIECTKELFDFVSENGTPNTYQIGIDYIASLPEQA